MAGGGRDPDAQGWVVLIFKDGEVYGCFGEYLKRTSRNLFLYLVRAWIADLPEEERSRWKATPYAVQNSSMFYREHNINIESAPGLKSYVNLDP